MSKPGPKRPQRPLLSHQVPAFEYAKDNPKIALFMEMRLGKTIVTIRWINQLRAASRHTGPALIVAPLSVLPVWQEELFKESVPSNLVQTLTGPKASLLSSLKLPRNSFFLVNYERLRATPSLSSIPWAFVVLDESTKIRNPKAQITKLCTRNFEMTPFKAILSGLPAPESPLDYCEQFRFLYGSFCGFKNYWALRDRYFLQFGYEWVPKKGTIETFRSFVHADSFILSRKQAGIGPGKVYEKRYVEPNALQKKAEKEVKKDFSYTSLDRCTVLTKWVPVKFLWLSRLAGGFDPLGRCISNAKFQEVFYLLTTELKENKVVIWCRFNREIEELYHYLTERDLYGFTITGEDVLKDRHKVINIWKSDPKTQFIICQMKVGKYGLDLSEASAAIYYSNSYDLEDRAQSEDRIVHPMKKESALFIDIITRGTIDEDVAAALREKNISSKLLLLRIFENWKERHGR